jgi:biotin carboxyl carrier protein
MKYEVRISGNRYIVELDRQGDGWRAKLDGESCVADVAETAPNTFSVLLSGQSREVCVTLSPGGNLQLQTGRFEFAGAVIDPRAWRGRQHGGVEAEGRQQIVAPMPGKIVRLLVKAGGAIEAGQGLLVVEAMKMQNEIRSPKRGIVERLLVAEGQTVNSGEILAWVN